MSLQNFALALFSISLGTYNRAKIGKNAYAKFWRDKKEYYGIFEKTYVNCRPRENSGEVVALRRLSPFRKRLVAIFNVHATTGIKSLVIDTITIRQMMRLGIVFDRTTLKPKLHFRQMLWKGFGSPVCYFMHLKLFETLYRSVC